MLSPASVTVTRYAETEGMGTPLGGARNTQNHKCGLLDKDSSGQQYEWDLHLLGATQELRAPTTPRSSSAAPWVTLGVLLDFHSIARMLPLQPPG